MIWTYTLKENPHIRLVDKIIVGGMGKTKVIWIEVIQSTLWGV